MLGKPMRVVLALLIIFLLPATALASQWVASKVAHGVHYTVDNKKWVRIKRGMTLPKRSWIRTGKRGRLILRRGKEMIMYRQNTLAYLRSSQTNGRKTYIQQQFGSLLLDVETRKRKHVTVKTPLLAAVVKGTRFEVNVSKRKATVSVKRGVVGVRSAKGGQAIDVTSGQNAGVSSSSSSKISVTGRGTSKLSPLSRIFSRKSNSDSNSSGSDDSISGSNNGNSTGNASGNANGNSDGNSNGNANGNSDASSNGNANGNSDGNSNGNANGNNDGNSNGNANGNSNGNANGNSNGNGNGNSNGN